MVYVSEYFISDPIDDRRFAQSQHVLMRIHVIKNELRPIKSDLDLNVQYCKQQKMAWKEFLASHPTSSLRKLSEEETTEYIRMKKLLREARKSVEKSEKVHKELLTELKYLTEALVFLNSKLYKS